MPALSPRPARARLPDAATVVANRESRFMVGSFQMGAALHLLGSCDGGRLKAWGISPKFAIRRAGLSNYSAMGIVVVTDIQNLLELTGIQQDNLDPVLGLVGLLTS